MNVVNAVGRSATPKIGSSTTASNAVMPTGRASVTQSTSTTTKMAAIRWPSGGSASGPGKPRTTRASTAAATTPARAWVVGAGGSFTVGAVACI